MPGFPVNLDLTAYFNDLRKYSSVFVNLSKCKDVGDVENHIKSVFKFEDNICLINKKFLIPKSEDVQILQQYDILKVLKCDFYDTQIHKIKRVSNNLPSDQNALNLIQSEKSIDLSCRPKQRIKPNSSQSPCIAGASTYSKENDKSRDSAWSFSSVTCVLGVENQVSPKEKQKCKKKRLTINDEDSNNDDDSNILDMSVKKSKRRRHENCFSTDEKNETEESRSPVRYENSYTENLKDSAAEYPKKSKKRKKYHSQCTDEDVDLSSTCWNNLVCDNSFNARGHKKKSKKNKDVSLSTEINGHSDDVMENVNDLPNSAQEECLGRKKQKKSKKLSESKINHDALDDQYYENTTILKTKTHASENIDFLEKYERENSKTCESSKTFEDSKMRSLIKTCDQMYKEKSSDNSPLVYDNKNSNISARLSSSNNEGCTEGDDSQDVKQNSEFFSDLSDSHNKRRRRRKRNKKKNVENLMYVSAVGPALNLLATQPSKLYKTPQSDNGKHIFFSEENLPEEITNKVQSVQGEPNVDHPKTTTNQEMASQISWQNDFLKLMNSKSKPVVFHRTTPTTISERCNNLSEQNPQPGPSTENHERDIRNCNGINYGMEAIKEIQIKSGEDCSNHTGEGKTENMDSTSTENKNSCGSRGRLPDIIRQRPIPNDLQNINLSDYPIIDKVVKGDLILFKVHKLTENNEPGVSKTILAKVSESSQFPSSISLQVMEPILKRCPSSRP